MASTTDTISLRARTIAIVGAGPSGIIAAKYLLAEKAFDKVVLFEQRSTCGGIWNYTPNLVDEDLFIIPQTDPRGRVQHPVWQEQDTATAPSSSSSQTNGINGVKRIPTFLSPIYETLETNIPRGLMGFQDLDWPQDSQLFPKHETVLQYIQDYAKDVQNLVQYETQVLSLQPTTASPSTSWTLTTVHLPTHTNTTSTYDAVIVANGHFITPYIPDIPGIREWNATFPGSITHSKYYRRAEEYQGKKVIVVGNSASGLDISSQIASHSLHPLLWSSKSPSLTFTAPKDTRKLELPPIKTFIVEKRAVEFEDGTIESGIDAIIFATGYFYSLPFLKHLSLPLITDGSHVNNTYKHLFHAPQPTLSFLALPQRVIPFPVAEAQSAVLSRVYSGRLSLPPLPEMQAWEASVTQEMGNGRDFHLLSFPKDGNYINELHDWAMSAGKREGLENDGQGKKPPRWGAWEFWCRENFPKIRAAFVGKGEVRHEIRTLGGLGFDFEEERRKKAEGEKLI